MTQTQSSDTQYRLISHLYSLTGKDKDRGALATLRKGLDGTPAAMLDLARHVQPYLPARGDARYQTACYWVAALFGLHPPDNPQTVTGNMGDTFRAVATASSATESLENRFTALLKTHFDDLLAHLRHAVALAKSNDVDVNYAQLLKDIINWDHQDAFVQRKWAQSFWSARQETTNQGGDESNPETTGE